MRRRLGLAAWPALISAVALAAGAPALARGAAPSPPQAPAANVALGRAILKALVETDTTHAFGSTGAARALQARLIAAGFPPADVVVAIPPGHPTKGNVVVRLRGAGRRPPVLWIGHLDVVEARREDWTYDPFRLTEADGWLYGRGTMDLKGQDAAMLASLIRLHDAGYRPDRDIIVALTADEEAGGDANGVQWLVAARPDLIDAALVINPDGGEAAEADGRKLFVGVQRAEKVFVSYQLEATDKGGHSSEPTPANPIYRIARALDRLDAHPFPVDLTPVARAYFRARAGLETGQLRADMLEVAAANPSPAALARLSRQVEINGLMRTTCVATMIDGGQAESALPERARAVIQCRVVPSEAPAGIQAELSRIIDDPQVRLSIYSPAIPSPESPPSAEVEGAVAAIVGEMWPGVAVLPQMSAGGSDSVFTRAAGIASYGVDAMFTDDDRSHGRDERIGADVFPQELEFTWRLMKRLTGG